MDTLLITEQRNIKKVSWHYNENNERVKEVTINQQLIDDIESNPSLINVHHDNIHIFFSYWLQIGYGDLVDALIRERYSISQEFAILRQRDSKPEEFAAYNEYAEQCKIKAQNMIQERDTALGV